MSARSKLFKIVLPLLIVVAAFIAMRLMILNRPEPKKEARENPGALVEVATVARGERQVEVQGTGAVQPRQEISVIPQISGRVVEVAPGFVAGGFFRRGEVLFRVDDADYRLAVDKAQAAMAKAEYDLATIEGQARIAREEWDRLKLADGQQPNPLVVYEPQLKNARAALLSARATLGQAELDLDRTVLRAPFNALVRSESLDLGQYLQAGTSVALLAGTDQAEIVVPLPRQDLEWLHLPRRGELEEGAAATVRLAGAGQNYDWVGRLVRTLGDVDPQGRMFRVVVAVDDPYGLQDRQAGRPELAIGSFVEVLLQGKTLRDVAVLPASALRDGGTVWVMNDTHLKIRPVELLRRTRDEVVIGSGLAAGDQVVLTALAGAAEGMKLRPAATPQERATAVAGETAESRP
ncbi:MAG TPA: efflux RND transporter periplasmic adaptor subunit [Desulfuromonadales bacterium]|nr:efflux RND transporter periplasmic adaptor subunit [Desulfuromonadales bacterium]